MKYQFLILIITSLFSINIGAQNTLKFNNLNTNLTETEKKTLTNSVNELFDNINNRTLDSSFFERNFQDISLSIFSSLANQEKEKKTDTVNVYQKRIINCYPINPNNDQMITISYIKTTDSQEPKIKLLFSFIAINESNKYSFTLPLSYYTKYWKSETVGKTNYIFKNKIDTDRALIFDKKNDIIAHKMKQEPEAFTFYMCDNYQELNRLLGFDYEQSNNGKTNNGYGVDSGHIFSIKNNEDFSHDIFHYYSGKIHERSERNWITEEGIAYMWGNAYYTDKKGEMVSQERLILELKEFLKENPETTPLDLFTQNAKIYDHIFNKIKVRSVISGIICTEIEKQKGIEGIYQIINCGRQKPMKKFMAEVEKLIGINTTNFNERINLLINQL